ncbi:unnamed protein product, partial [Phaeothamnion confervicola]
AIANITVNVTAWPGVRQVGPPAVRLAGRVSDGDIDERLLQLDAFVARVYDRGDRAEHRVSPVALAGGMREEGRRGLQRRPNPNRPDQPREDLGDLRVLLRDQ